MPICEKAVITENVSIAPNVFSLRAGVPEISEISAPGRFINFSCDMQGALLRRPLSICDADGDTLRLVYEVRGAGTEWLSRRAAGETLSLSGPLGHGYSFDAAGKYILVGGGMGCAPLLFAARKLQKRADAVLGFRDKKRLMLADDFFAFCDNVALTTDDGSFGIHGPVTIPLREMLERGGYSGVLACGPKPMLRAVAELSESFKIPCQVSMEERMACGMGACLVCVCETKTADGEAKMSRVCRDGPVFDSAEVNW